MNIWKELKKHIEILNNFEEMIDEDNYQKILSNMYKYIKSNTYLYFENNVKSLAYEHLKLCLLLVERKAENVKILDIPFELVNSNNLIDDIVLNTRKYLIEKHRNSGELDLVNVSNINLTNDCMMASEYVKYLCDLNNVKSYIIEIYPGYCKDAEIYNGNGYHFANIINYNNNYYLVDTTYQQFFYASKNNLDRLGIVEISGCDVGTFALMNKSRKDIAINILKNGYIKLDERIFKDYLDSFTIHFRNGLYYEKTSDFSYTTNYSVDDYVNFLMGCDNQIKHEGMENLGYQKRMLKNPNLDFKIKM